MEGAAPYRRFLIAFGALLTAGSIACAGTAVAPERPAGVVGPPGTENVYIVVGEIVLNGRLFGAENETLVVLSHMRPSDQTAWFPFAEELAENGYAALTLNFRGYGASQGDQDFDKLADDLSATVSYMRQRGWGDVFLIGASMGGTTSLVLAAEEGVRGVVALSAPAVFESQDALSAVPAITAPKLFIASEEDTAAMASLDELLAAASEPKESEIYPGGAHGTNLFQSEHDTAVRQRILQFLQEQGGP
ncbi:MAG: alpha/beta fold hydrolase [Chloroflexi bacterium]|nr:alpha/beta fold hydrolase [Chloroflexota bacterium]